MPVLALVPVLLVAAGGVPSRAAPEREGHWVLTFEDEFRGDAVDGAKWDNGFGWGPTSRDTFGYCDPGHNTVSGGVLRQRIVRAAPAQDGRAWRVGCLNTRGHFAQRHGYFEARIRAAGCDGARAAFWAKPADESWPPELDVVEVHGDEPDVARFTVHYRDPGPQPDGVETDADGVSRARGRFQGPDFSGGYHVFAAEWGPDGTTWYVDGVERFRTAGGASALGAGGPFYLILNAQVYRSSSTCEDATQLVDWVRIWERALG